MSTAQQDTEITLGTGRMLVLFFAFVLVCAFFFAIGFSLGRRTAMAVAGNLVSAPTGSPATIVRPSPAKNEASQPSPQSGDFSFYKAVGEKSAGTALTPGDPKLPPASPAPAASTAEAAPKAATDATNTAPL